MKIAILQKFEHSRTVILAGAAIAVLGIAALAEPWETTNNEPAVNIENGEMNIDFQNIESDKIKESFEEVVRAYDVLHPYPITLEQRPIRNTTMQAKPIISFFDLFGKRKRYKVNLARYVSDSDEMAVRELPAEVLTGWFAHELGHLVDYECRSNMGMVGFGVRYLTSKRFKRQAEHAADMIAIEHGFHDEIIATKRFILEHDLLGDKYKAQIIKYYMSIEAVELCIEDDKMPVVEQVLPD
ncbi:MAG: hypothetical protein LC670_06900 [Flavobacteriales bacterium]|nr:hypothetical protein [Flavobacteriales bacterium]